MKVALTFAWIVALVAALVATTKRTTEFAEQHAKLLDEPPLTRLDTRFLDILTLGHRGLYDDMANIWLLQVLTDERLKAADPVEVQRYVRSVTRHRPKVESLYMMACFVLDIDFKRADLCEDIMVDGINAFPNGWRIPVTQGFMALHKLQDTAGAAKFYGLAATQPDAPEWLKKLAKNLVDNNGLSVTELQQSLEQLLDVPGGSRFGDFLKDRGNQQGGP